MAGPLDKENGAAHLKRAISLLSKSQECQRMLPELFNLLGMFEMEQGHHEEVVRLASRGLSILQLMPDGAPELISRAALYSMLGGAQYHLGLTAEAESSFKNASEVGGDWFAPMSCLADLLENDKKVDAAAVVLTGLL